jgi:hypothetical protein
MPARKEILYHVGNYTVRKAAKGYEVYRENAVVAERCAIIGSEGPRWFRRAVAEADKRAALAKAEG